MRQSSLVAVGFAAFSIVSINASGYCQLQGVDFPQDQYDLALDENTGGGVSIADVKYEGSSGVGDACSISGSDSASFSVEQGETGGSFLTAPERYCRIKTESGVTYDHESKAVYSIILEVSAVLTSDTAAVTISINDVDEPPSPPDAPGVRASSTTSLDVRRTAPDNTGKPDITSYDIELGKDIDSLVAGPQDVAETSVTISGLEEDTRYFVKVRATNDEGDGPYSSAGEGLTDSRLNSRPIFDQLSTRSTPIAFTLEEETAAGEDVGTALTVTDADSGDTLTFTLEGSDSGHFSIDSSTDRVQIQTSAIFDHDEGGFDDTKSLEVLVSDGTASETAYVEIAITDKQEIPPVPTGFKVSSMESGSSLTASWDSPVAGDHPPVSEHRLRWKKATDADFAYELVPVARTSHTISGLEFGLTYSVGLEPRNEDSGIDESNFAIAVVDAIVTDPPIPLFAEDWYSVSMDEGTETSPVAAGTIVGSPIVARDGREAVVLSYSLENDGY